MQYPTIKHHWYCVTAKTDCTITSPSGLNVSLSAGTQSFVYADADSLEIAGEATLTQTPGRFSPAPAAAPGGGGNAAPVIEQLSPDTCLHHGRVYTITHGGEEIDLSALSIGAVGSTAEIWLECASAHPIIWPCDWLWSEGEAPASLERNMLYCFVIRSGGSRIIAHMAYNYPLL